VNDYHGASSPVFRAINDAAKSERANFGEQKALRRAGRAPDDEAATRAALSAILCVEYPAFAYDAKRVAQTLARAKRMLRLLATLEANHRAQFAGAGLLGGPPSRLTDMATERDVAAIEAMRLRWETMLAGMEMLRSAHKGRRKVQHDSLMHRLCGVWLDHFHGELRAIVPALGGPPTGPCIEFLCAAISLVAPDFTSPATIRDSMYRERDGRKRARQMSLDLRARRGSMLD
jgi:hypothetical protein